MIVRTTAAIAVNGTLVSEGATVDVLEVHLCRASPHLRSLEIENPEGGGDRTKNTFLLVPAKDIRLEEPQGWQTYARGVEARTVALKAA